MKTIITENNYRIQISNPQLPDNRFKIIICSKSIYPNLDKHKRERWELEDVCLVKDVEDVINYYKSGNKGRYYEKK